MVHGVAIENYRSIGERQIVGPLGKINLFVGPNNAGKSNILRFVNANLRHLVQHLARAGSLELPDRAAHLRRGEPASAQLAVPASPDKVSEVLGAQKPREFEVAALVHKHLCLPGDQLWIGQGWPSKALVDQASQWGEQEAWYSLAFRGTNTSGGSLKVHWVPETLARLRRLIPAPPRVFCIPIDRRAGKDEDSKSADDALTVLGGRGVIRALAAMQNPKASNYDADRKRFEAVQEFVRTVTDDPSANITVPHAQDEILVKLRGQSYLPLADLGSGIEQVVLHAVAATSATDGVVTFEEPELHLHPVLQRQLIRYLLSTSNQYFISTHSANLVDALHTDTFHVRLVDGQTIVERAETDAHRHAICTDLGYRPSDLVQANCIIWVEGPSDRVYLRYWLKLVDAHLKEHIHFSIMSYGGKLLSHLSAGETDAADTALNDLIQLRLLNRHVAVIIDSDRASTSDPIRPTKQRVKEEIEQHGGMAWVTAGREIENYVPLQVLRDAVEAVAEGRGGAVKGGQFTKALPAAKPHGKQPINKVAVALKVTELGCDLASLDLQAQVVKLARFIRNANGLPANSDA